MLAVDAVHNLELRQIDHEDRGFDHIDEIKSRSRKHFAEVLQRAPRLEFDAAADYFASAGSSATWPEQNTKPFCAAACEYGPIAWGALRV